MTYSRLLLRGLAAGGLAGLAAGIVGLLVVEPAIRVALRIEEARSAGAAEHTHDEVFSRPVQVVGGVAAAVVVGLAIGAVFATVFAATAHRGAGRAAFSRSLVAAAVGFGAVAALPAVKYPANPPGVGDPESVNYRTVLYLTLIAAGLAVAFGVGRLNAALTARASLAQPVRVTLVTAVAVATVVLMLLVWPASPDTVPADVPAALLWRFRLASLAEQATMWAVLGFAFGLLAERRPAVAPAVPATA